MLHHTRGGMRCVRFVRFVAKLVRLLHFLLAPFTMLWPLRAARLRGTVTDPLGASLSQPQWNCSTAHPSWKKPLPMPLATISFHLQKAARYQVRVVAPTFQSTTSDAVFVTTACGKARDRHHPGHPDADPAGNRDRHRNPDTRSAGGRASDRADTRMNTVTRPKCRIRCA